MVKGKLNLSEYPKRGARQMGGFRRSESAGANTTKSGGGKFLWSRTIRRGGSNFSPKVSIKKVREKKPRKA